MKKALRIVFTILFVACLAFEIYALVKSYSDDALFFVILAGAVFLFYLFAWIAPKTLLNICWRLSRFYPDAGDYDAGLANMGNVSLGLIIIANISVIISILLTVL